ncbi:MAG: glycosyltransferase [Planctomycetota bacterium]
MYYAFLIPYIVVLSVCAIYGIHRYMLLYLYYRSKDRAPRATCRMDDVPTVTIQLPICNEREVVERVIGSACKVDYPSGKLEIQVLDDSKDEDDTSEIAQRLVEHYRREGVNIHYLHRRERVGYKAGNLAYGLERASGELVAIFDADFIVPRDILNRMVHHFADPTVGMVQSRWEHINRNFNKLTQGSAVFLDGHFQIEHAARNRNGRFMSFNGTGGIWRREAIEQAGGWQTDTLTEDLDLSYRAQLAGWRFVYLDSVLSPGELPMDIAAFKNQHHRWTKGGIQTAKKLLGRIVRSAQPIKVKLEAAFHLTNSAVYPYMVLLGLLLFPMLVLSAPHGSFWKSPQRILFDLPLFLVATCSTSAFYITSQRELGQSVWKTVKLLPFLTALGIGMSLNNTLAVIEAMVGYKSPFVRTPKYGVTSLNQALKMKTYRGPRGFVAWVEMAMGCLFAVLSIWTLLMAIQVSLGYLIALPFVGMFSFGYLYVGVLSVFQADVGLAPIATAAAETRQN